MPWQRRGKRLVYYRSVRIAGKAVKKYVGTGAKAQQAAHEVEQRRLGREAEREGLRQARQRTVAAVQALQDLHAVTTLLLRSTLVAAGFHEHHGV